MYEKEKKNQKLTENLGKCFQFSPSGLVINEKIIQQLNLKNKGKIAGVLEVLEKKKSKQCLSAGKGSYHDNRKKNYFERIPGSNAEN